MKKLHLALLLASFIVPSVSIASIDTNLKYGSRGGDVTELQEFLIDKGFLAGQSSGNFFSLTRKAVVAYQVSVGLPATGFVGPMSRAKINDDLSQTNASSVSAEILETGTTTPALINGCSSNTGFSTTTGNSCSGAITETKPVATTSKTMTLQNGAVVEVDSSGNIIRFVSFPVAELVSTQAQPSVVNTIQTPAKISQAHIELSNPKGFIKRLDPVTGVDVGFRTLPTGCGLVPNSIHNEANCQYAENNFIWIRADVYGDDGLNTRNAVVKVSTTDPLQDRTMDGTGNLAGSSQYPNPGNYYYDFTYFFLKPGTHTITFSANGVFNSITINAN